MINTYNIALPKFAHFLITDNLLDKETIMDAVLKASVANSPFISYLIEKNILNEEIILQCAAKHSGLTIFDLQEFDFSILENTSIKAEVLLHYHLLPIKLEQEHLYVAVSDPFDDKALTAIGFHTGFPIKPLLVAETSLTNMLNKYFLNENKKNEIQSAIVKIQTIKPENITTNPADSVDNASIIDLVDQLIKDAIQKKASDIHLEPWQNFYRVRYRRDGLLYDITQIPYDVATQINTRLKVMAQINIAEKRLPQDGRIFLVYLKVNIRISTCPTLFGEKIVLRLLGCNQINLKITELGLTDEQLNLLYATLAKPQGMLLIAGPTGSGKTITLYAALHYLNCQEKNILTIEDPVEIELQGINQVNINRAIGFDFAQALRAFLRQDPDIIMVGEIRDAATATIALQAAQTGHLVLATVHAANTLESIARLQAMGVTTYQLFTSLSLVIAQRLVRKCCLNCNTMQSTIKITHVNCENCMNGYQGRTGIFEFLPIVNKHSNNLTLKESNWEFSFSDIQTTKNLTLWDAGLLKVKKGITTYNELSRVMGQN